MVSANELQIRSLGNCRIDSPLAAEDHDLKFLEQDDRILYDDRLGKAGANDPPSLELAGPRSKIYFDPSKIRVGIVTCGGLCPGLNDVIRGLVMELWYRYGVRHIYGFRYGFQGFIAKYKHDAVDLEPKVVDGIHHQGGSFLASSRGDQDISEVVDCLDRMSIRILFVIGGDGTIRGAQAIVHEIDGRDARIAVVGVPKTIDNDILFLDQSFGFQTAYSEAVESIESAHVEAKGAPNGVGVVRLMGRHSGFIACHAALATSDVNFVLIPELSFKLDGEHGFLNVLKKRLARRRHAVVVVAEGAGQDLLEQDSGHKDASGNVKLKDIGLFLKDRIKGHFAKSAMEVNLKYIDPSYIIRSVPASPSDSIYCWRLAQNAVHAAMCGKTAMIIGQWHNRLVHVPMELATSGRKQVDPKGDLWLSVLESTGQPPAFE